MTCLYKPNFDESRDAWAHYWAREKWKRPLVVPFALPKGKGIPWPEALKNNYYQAASGNHEAMLDAMDEWYENTVWPAEAMPFFGPDHGPDQFAAFLGAKLQFDPNSLGTNWVHPFVENWADVLPLKIDENSPTWKSLLSLVRKMGTRGRGRYMTGMIDLHSNTDALSAIRGPDRLCMDFYDCPEFVERAMQDVRKLFPIVYNAIYEAGQFDNTTGTTGWTPFWCAGKFATIQCDFICMVSPEIGRRFIIPALEEEANFLDHCVYHLDGPGALPHLDDILAIKKIDVIQWVSGAGQPRMWTSPWIDLLKKCQKAGKGLQMYDMSIEEAKQVHKELDPAGLVYCVPAASEKEVDEFCHWLERNS